MKIVLYRIRPKPSEKSPKGIPFQSTPYSGFRAHLRQYRRRIKRRETGITISCQPMACET